MPESEQRARYDRALKRGALFNVLGGLAKLVQPFYILCITWLWGPAMTGLYLLGQSLIEVASAGLTAGYGDATTIFASRHVDGAAQEDDEHKALYRVLANTFALPVGLSLAFSLLTLLLARPLVDLVLSGYEELLPGLYLLTFSLVPRAVAVIAIAATKATMRMEHDALLMGVAHPLCMLGGCFLVFALGGGLTSLFALQLTVDTVIAALAIQAFRQYFSLSALRTALLGFHFDGELLHFAVPQSLNLTFNRYIARLDAIMLASFGISHEALGYFGTAAMLTSNLGQIRVAFSGALAPVVARHHLRGERQAFQEVLSRVARWTTSLVVPAVLMCAVLRVDLLQLVSKSYGKDSLFVVVLLIPPLTNCAYGMAGACLMFTGHSRVTLVNSFCVALLNTVFTYLLIPPYGMLGAAIGTLIASSIITSAQMLELWRFEGVWIAWRAVWKPHLGLLVGVLCLVPFWDPVELPRAERLALAFGELALFVLVMLALRHEELMSILHGTPPARISNRGPESEP